MLNIDIFFSILKLDNLDQNIVDSNQLVCLLSNKRRNAFEVNRIIAFLQIF